MTTAPIQATVEAQQNLMASVSVDTDTASVPPTAPMIAASMIVVRTAAFSARTLVSVIPMDVTMCQNQDLRNNIELCYTILL